ncbi:hypothetical protein [Nocardia sp. NRRL S-836]|uniref:hypothetical protein n=1 Tax=Nocardia sp. NRRL S-836 TaxID=1519492 RepID=UPI0006AF85CF|nr:hypothetical protein [Nocardia sp. NRRL S-836]KOV89761.1 hypothetical protein ADL03_02985 [Nocardia sp. NRRL S-836]
MVVRTVVGAVTGAVVGAGFVVTVHELPSRGPGYLVLAAVPVLFAFWAFVAGVLIAGGFRLGRQERGWWATGIGSGLWVVVVVSLVLGRVFSKHAYPQLVEVVLILVPCVAYALAALFTSRRPVA